MKFLHLDQISANPESSQQRAKQAIKGADVFEWNLLRALLEHGTYDAYLIQGLTEEKRQLLLNGGLRTADLQRVIPVPFGGPLPVTDSDQLVFLTAGRFLNALAVARQKWKQHQAPVCGFIHSINSARIALALLQQCFVGLSEADLLFCSSRAGMKTIDAYIAEINHLLPQELHYPARRVLVPLGVNIPVVLQDAGKNLRQLLNIGQQVSTAMYFGRLSQGSKCDLGPLLVALSQLLKRRKDLFLIIAGDDTQTQESPRLQALAGELGCQRNLKIWINPSATEKHLLYSGADFFVSPSDNMQETFGLTVAEAMAYGLPAIVSDWDGYRDLVRDGQTGFLVPTVLPSRVEELRLCDCATSMLEEDALARSTTVDVEALSQKMETLAVDSNLRMQMGQASRNFIESCCSWRVVVKQYEEFWEESLAKAKAKKSNSSESSHLLNLPLEKCFGHYASEKRSQKEKCFITPEGQEWLKRPGRFYLLDGSSSACPQRFVSVLRFICDDPGITSAKVVEAFKGQDPQVIGHVEWVIARLFKYGLVMDKQTHTL